MAKKQLTLEEQVRDCAEKAGITAEQAEAAIGGKAIGDGKFLEKFLKFLSLLLPYIIPIISSDPADDVKDE